MAVTYVKKIGAPAGRIHFSVGNSSFDIDDSTNTSIVTNSAEVVQALDGNLYLQREGAGEVFEPPPDTGGGGTGGGAASWKSPVATTGALPTSGNFDGDVRLVLSDYSIHAWNATSSAWISVAAGGSGTSRDYIDVPANLAGITAGQTPIWSAAFSQFRPGGLS